MYTCCSLILLKTRPPKRWSANINHNPITMDYWSRTRTVKDQDCRAEERGRVHGRPVSTTRVDGPSWRVSKNAPEFSGRQLGPWTRAVNSGSGNRPLQMKYVYRPGVSTRAYDRSGRGQNFCSSFTPPYVTAAPLTRPPAPVTSPQVPLPLHRFFLLRQSLAYPIFGPAPLDFPLRSHALDWALIADILPLSHAPLKWSKIEISVESQCRPIYMVAQKNGATGHPMSLQIFRKLHDRIAWKLVDFCNIICWTQSLTFCLKISSRFGDT